MCELSYCNAGKLSPCPPEVLLEHLCPDEPVLEIGCGEGVLLKTLAAHGFCAVGVEPNAAYVNCCHEAGLSVVAGSAEKVPFSDSSFGSVILECVYSLCEPAATRKELRRLLRPGGKLLIADLFAEQSLLPEATQTPLIGRLFTKAQLESEFLRTFKLIDFFDLTQALRQYLLQQMLSGGDCVPNAADRALLRRIKLKYGLWIWKKR